MIPSNYHYFMAEMVVDEAFSPANPDGFDLDMMEREQLEERLAKCTLWQLAVRWRILAQPQRYAAQVKSLQAFVMGLRNEPHQRRMSTEELISTASKPANRLAVYEVPPTGFDQQTPFQKDSVVKQALLTSLEQTSQLPRGTHEQRQHIALFLDEFATPSAGTAWAALLATAEWIDAEIDRPLGLS